MCYAIRIPLLYILYSPLSPPGHFGCPFGSIQLKYFKRLPECGKRLEEDVGACGELFAELGGKAPSFEGCDGGEEDKGALVG